jgi:predicted nucleotidyltransferase component of viral defense system
LIKAKEIQQKALQGGIRDTQIEKDYILSWILRGIAQHAALSKCLVFKGETVLKKSILTTTVFGRSGFYTA